MKIAKADQILIKWSQEVARMPDTPSYDVNAIWDDPFDRPPERRAEVRFEIRLKIKIAVEVSDSDTPLVGIARIQNISTQGVYCLTKHRLTVGEEVRLQFFTRGCPTDSGIAKQIYGTGRVVRVDPVDKRRSKVALQFDKNLSENIEFAIFADYLRSVSGIQSPS